ncbi:MAG: hypothetical protein EZS28_003771 [Streblomastix strix]|uniref:Uncharacterized protein n=1 Tax=Streblomastix strix TaxID=222440 RepID=A0A5J4X0Q0_9EUKA|nr:MAG: hypothetical protein EZS28_003771 [Streblomastix strix]
MKTNRRKNLCNTRGRGCIYSNVPQGIYRITFGDVEEEDNKLRDDKDEDYYYDDDGAINATIEDPLSTSHLYISGVKFDCLLNLDRFESNEDCVKVSLQILNDSTPLNTIYPLIESADY